MVSRRYSGYLADDESLRGPQIRNLNTSNRRATYDWRSLPRPLSRCQFQNQDTSSSFSAFTAATRANEETERRHENTFGESSRVANEFSDFVDFLADEDVLDSLQNIVEDAVRKLCEVTTDDGEHLFHLQEDSSSSPDSGSWSFSYSHRCGDTSSARSQSKYTTTTVTTTATSSSDDDWEGQYKHKTKPTLDGRVCLLDKYTSRLPKLEEKTVGGVSGGFHTESFSERFGDNYYFRQEHFHIWAKLAESFQYLQPPRKDYFSKFKKELPKQSFSVESLHKEITNVLKRPTPSSIPLYYPGHQPFHALDFLEENKILAALQGIINQAVYKVLEATMADGTAPFNLFDEQGQPLVPQDTSVAGSEEEGDDSGSGEESSDGDSKSEGGKSEDGKKKKRKGKRKKKGKGEMPAEEEKGKQKYTPPPLPKTKRKSTLPEEPQRKPKYVPPPLPKTKPRQLPEEPPPKPKYVPPPLPKPKQKKQDSAQAEAEAQSKQMSVAQRLRTPKDIKRARLQPRPLPKQAIIDFLIENAAKLILYKYNYETLLSEKLGFISVPVTKVLLEIMFGYKRIKGSGIWLCSQIDWSKVFDEIYAPRPPKPKAPKLKGGDKKKVREKKKKDGGEKKKKKDGGKSAIFKPPMPTGKVMVTRTQVRQEVESSKKKGRASTAEQEGNQVPEIYELVPPQFPEEPLDSEDVSVNEPAQSSTPKEPVTTTNDSPVRSTTSAYSTTRLVDVPPDSERPLPSVSSSRRPSVAPSSNRGSTSVLPEVELSNQPPGELRKASSSRKSSLAGEPSKRSSTILPKI